MGYLIELAVNLKNITNLTEIRNNLYNKAEKCQVETYYSTYEFMGVNRSLQRNHCILTFKFRENEELVAEFIKYTKLFHNVSIESVGYDNLIFKLMYASRKYLNIMEKYQAKKYLKARKQHTLFKQNSIILKAILKKK